MEEKIMNTELEDLRRQMQEFKSQLEKQKIVNEQLITASMKKSMSWIKKYVIFEICIIPFVALVWLAMKVILHLSWFNYGFLLCMLVLDVYVDYRINVSALTDEDYHRSNLVTTMLKLGRMKRQRRVSMMVSVPLLVLWLAWCGLEAWYNLPGNATEMERGMMYGNCVGLVVGGFIGLLVGMLIYRKMQSKNDEVISRMREFTGME